jgi:hypothetical protein
LKLKIIPRQRKPNSHPNNLSIKYLLITQLSARLISDALYKTISKMCNEAE